MSQTDVIIEIECQAEIHSGRLQRTRVGAISIVRKIRAEARHLAVRFFEKATTKASDYCYERSLNPDIGRWTITRSPILPGFEYKLSYTFLEETSEKPIDVFIRPGCRRVDKLVNAVKSLTKDYNPDVRLGKRKPDPMEETLTKNDLEKIVKRRPFGLRLPDSLTPSRQPERLVPSSAPARIPSCSGTPLKTPSKKISKDYLSMTISGRSSSEPGFCRNLSQALDFGDRDSENPDTPSSPREVVPFSPHANFSPTKVSRKGGLRNIGNSCYMNACISALAKTICWVDALTAISIPAKGNNCGDPISLCEEEDEREQNPSILAAAVDVIQYLRNGGSEDGAALEMLHLRQSLGRYHIQFANRAQQDAHEFLSGLMDKMEEEAKAMKLGEDLMSCISSTTSNQLCCTSCKYRRSKSEQWWNFSLNLPELPLDTGAEPRCCPEHGLQELMVSKTAENPGRQFWACRSPKRCTALPFKWGPESRSSPLSVSLLFSKYFQRHFLEYRCEKCPCNQAILEPAISKIPKVLILHLKRFHSDLQTNQCTKRIDAVDVELTLNITEFCLDERLREIGAKYRLRSVISHLGHQASNGHYVHDYRDPDTKSWTRYDDSSVKTIGEQTVLNEAQTQAYILFYDIDD